MVGGEPHGPAPCYLLLLVDLIHGGAQRPTDRIEHHPRPTRLIEVERHVFLVGRDDDLERLLAVAYGALSAVRNERVPVGHRAPSCFVAAFTALW